MIYYLSAFSLFRSHDSGEEFMMRKVLLFSTVISMSVWGININNTVWNTNWELMYFWQDGNRVSGEYMYDDGILTGTLSGDTLCGWWREYGNTKECGPENTWSGPLLFKFSADGKSFTGSWGYCNSDPSVLDPNGAGWTGTVKEGAASYTQQECEEGGRFWCNNECSLVPCDSELTQDACERSGRIWCADTCKMVPCDVTPILYPVSRRSSPEFKTLHPNNFSDTYFDLRGKRIKGRISGISVHLDASGRSRAMVTILP